MVALDLELNASGFECGKLVTHGQAWRFTNEDLIRVAAALEAAPLVVGHNLRPFDLPRFEELIARPLALSEDRFVDTLELASLAWPGRPSQALELLL